MTSSRTFFRGKIILPSSIPAAQAQHQHALYEAGKIDQKVQDPANRAKFAQQVEYDAWVHRAKDRARHYREEARQLGVWLAGQGSEPLPLRQPVTVVKETFSARVEDEDYSKFWETP